MWHDADPHCRARQGENADAKTGGDVEFCNLKTKRSPDCETAWGRKAPGKTKALGNKG